MGTSAVLRLGFCALALTALVLRTPSALSQTSACGRESFDHTHPYRMSSLLLWDYIQEYENPVVPTELQRELKGDRVSIAIRLDERGSVSSCSSLIVWEEPNQPAIHASAPVKEKTTETLCSSIRTSKFRQFRYCDKPVPVVGPVVFIVLDEKFKLQQIGPTAKERKPTR